MTTPCPYIGTDIVSVNRFESWLSLSDARLSRIFSPTELTYIRSDMTVSAQRMAVRFALKEAVFKALSASGISMPFLTVCRTTTVSHTTTGCPILESSCIPTGWYATCSLSHTDELACATVLIVLGHKL